MNVYKTSSRQIINQILQQTTHLIITPKTLAHHWQTLKLHTIQTHLTLPLTHTHRTQTILWFLNHTPKTLQTWPSNIIFWFHQSYHHHQQTHKLPFPDVRPARPHSLIDTDSRRHWSLTLITCLSRKLWHHRIKRLGRKPCKTNTTPWTNTQLALSLIHPLMRMFWGECGFSARRETRTTELFDSRPAGLSLETTRSRVWTTMTLMRL